MNKTIGITYLKISPSGKMYIGQTTKTVAHRWRQHCNHTRSKKKQHAIHNAIKKYGGDNFETCILFSGFCNKKELDEIERKYIKMLETDTKGYNETAGGEGGRQTLEVRKKMSASQKKLYENGYISPCKGKTHKEIHGPDWVHPSLGIKRNDTATMNKDPLFIFTCKIGLIFNKAVRTIEPSLIMWREIKNNRKRKERVII